MLGPDQFLMDIRADESSDDSLRRMAIAVHIIARHRISTQSLRMEQ
jgi:hypothetical protein